MVAAFITSRRSVSQVRQDGCQKLGASTKPQLGSEDVGGRGNFCISDLSIIYFLQIITMNLETISYKLAQAGGEEKESEIQIETLSMKELAKMARSDKYAEVVETALTLNSDLKPDLYLHQYKALYSLANGNDVLLISPCGSGKTRVLENAPLVAKLGFELRSGSIGCDTNPLGIVCCPLTAIIEDKLKDQPNSGMLSMFGSCKTGSGNRSKVSLSKCEGDFLSDKLALIYGHPESFATEIGKKVLESNEDRISVFICDEIGFNIWGPDFRPLMSNIPASIRVFSTMSAPMLCMSATVGKSEQQKVLEDSGMKIRNFEIIEQNPVMPHVFVSKVRRPSNQKGFLEPGGLKDILWDLFLKEFISDARNSRRAIIFCYNEEDLINVYECIENMAGDKFENMKTRPWVQYHGSTGEKTINWIHHRIKCGEGDLEIKLFICTYKLVMGVDIKKLDLAIFIR